MQYWVGLTRVYEYKMGSLATIRHGVVKRKMIDRFKNIVNSQWVTSNIPHSTARDSQDLDRRNQRMCFRGLPREEFPPFSTRYEPILLCSLEGRPEPR